MVRMEVNLPENVFERLAGESSYSGEPADSIIARALVMYFTQLFAMEGDSYSGDDD